MAAVLRPGVREVSLGAVLLAASGAQAVPEEVAALSITGISLDSRTVQPGDLYAALPGHLTHGAAFADAAVAAGAVAIVTDAEGAGRLATVPVPVIVVDQPRRALGDLAAAVYGRPASDLQVLGITGTNGKTTVASMVEAGLRRAGRTTGLIGTVGVQVADQVHPGARTTPEATDLHAILAVMRDAGVQSMVMEVSSIALEERRVDGLVFDVSAFTNLSQDHLDYHGTMEAYFAAKADLFTPERSRLGIIGVDDPWGQRLAAECRIPFRTWSLLDPRADFHVVREGGGTAVVGPDGGPQPLELPMPGAFNVANAICAIAVLDAAGIDMTAAIEGVQTARVPGRMQVVGTVAGVTGIVDYAHSPDAVDRVIRAARDVAPGRVIVVLGAGGDRDRTKRPIMGQTAARLADVLVITDDNPRSEEPSAIRAAVGEGARGVPPRERAEILEVGDRSEAITVAVTVARSGDMVLVLGKGHEQGQEASGVITPFDDATALRSALDATALGGGADEGAPS